MRNACLQNCMRDSSSFTASGCWIRLKTRSHTFFNSSEFFFGQDYISGFNSEGFSESFLSFSRLLISFIKGAVATSAACESRCPRRCLFPQRSEAVIEFIGERALKSQIKLLISGSAVASEADLRKRGDLLSERFCFLSSSAIWRDSIREPDAQRFSRVNGAACQNKVERAAQSDQSRKPHGPAVNQRYPPAATEYAERRAFFHHAQVAPERKLKPARDRVARDGCDDRLR